MSKRINIAAKPTAQMKPSADEWVEKRGGEIRAPEETAPASTAATTKPKRLTIDVSESLHRRIKVSCAQDGTQMADVIREILERSFAEVPVNVA
jgi:predicted DNA binding CopG/RHH family protein